MDELKLKQTVTRLLSKTKNQKYEIYELKARIKGFKDREEVFLKALAARKCYPKFVCGCYKDDCGCLEESLKK
jgi:hypothetical protein